MVGVGIVLTISVLLVRSCDFSLSFGDPCGGSNDRFIEAVVAGETGTVREELDDGADPNESIDDVTPLRCAVGAHRTEVVAMLIDAGARPNNTTFLSDAVSAGDVEIVRLLLDAGSTPTPDLLDTTAGGDPDPLSHSSAKRATPDEAAVIAELLLARGVDPNADAKGPTPLLWAAFNGRPGVVAALLAHGADPDRGGVVDKTLIQFAQLSAGNGALVPEPSGPTVANVPPLVAAAWTGNLEVATMLLDSGADPNLAADDAFTAIYAAAVLGNDATVQLLFDRGATPVPAVRPGVMTPAEVARAANQPDTATLIDRRSG